MRRIMSLLSEYACEELNSTGYGRLIPETRDMFRFGDSLLNSAKPAKLGPFETPETKLMEVMTSAAFQYAIGTFVSRSVVPGYESKRFAFEPLVKPVTVTNFMQATTYQNRQGVDDLEYVREKGPPRPGTHADAVPRAFGAYRWEKQFDFSMETLVNDDLGYLNDQGRLMGLAARRTLEKYVSRMINNATTRGRLTGLTFNLYWQNGRLTSTRISEARMGFNQRVDDAAEPMRVTAKYLLHHAGLVDTVDVIQNSQLVPELATNAANVVGRRFTPIEDPYMVGVAPNLPWYMFTDWKTENVVPLILVRLTMLPAPMVLRKKSDIETFTSFAGGGAPISPMFGDFHTSNILLKVVDAWGTYIDDTEGNLYDYRGAYYSTGTAA